MRRTEWAALLVGILVMASGLAWPAAGIDQPGLRLQAARSLPIAFGGEAAGGLRPGTRPLALAAGDFDRDGLRDLIAGYATDRGGLLTIQRGNREAFRFGAASASGVAPAPFVAEASAIALGAAPDFIASGDFNRDQRLDLIAAARGADQLFFLAGDGHGGFAAPLAIALPGTVTALAADGLTQLVIGANTAEGPRALIYQAGRSGPEAEAALSLREEITALALGQLDDRAPVDLAIAAGHELILFAGSSGRGSAAAAVLETIQLPYRVRDLAFGGLIWDRDYRMELALLAEDGVVHVLRREALDQRPISAQDILERARIQPTPRTEAQLAWARAKLVAAGYPELAQPAPARGAGAWVEAESHAVLASSAATGAARLLVAPLSNRKIQDLVVLDPAGRLHIVFGDAPPSGPKSARARPQPITVPTQGAPVAALALRLGAAGGPGLVLMSAGTGVSLLPAVPRAVFSVDTSADTVDAAAGDGFCADAGGDCSLRAAVMESNASPGADTIMLPAGTYTLTLGPGDDDTVSVPDASGDLDVCGIIGGLFGCSGGFPDNDLTVLGAGAATTIIDGAGIDRIFDVDPIFGGDGLSLTLTDLTLSGGAAAQPSLAGGDGGAVRFLGGEFFAAAHGSLTVTDCVLDTNQSDDTNAGTGSGAPAGAIEVVFGSLSVSGTTFSNNQASRGAGGAVLYDGGGSGPSTLSITGSLFDTNHALGSPADFITGLGGGLFATGASPAAAAPQVAVDGTDFTTNDADDGGAITIVSNPMVSLGPDLAVSGNSAAGKGAGVAQTGSSTTLLTESTFTANSAGSGGGALYVADGTLTANLNRFVDNLGASSGIAQVGGTASVENNWWGCDDFPNGVGCDSASGTYDADPRLDLRLLPMPALVFTGGMSTLQADVTQNSDGMAVAAAVLEGLTVDFSSDALGSVSPGSDTISGGIATSTFTAGAVTGFSTVSAMLDNGTETAQIEIQEPPCAISCPDDQEVFNDPGACGATVDYPAPTTSGTCGTVTCAPEAGTFFGVGSTEVTCTTTAGPSCSFDVIVKDNEPPVLSCATAVSSLWPANHDLVNVGLSGSGSENCPDPSVSISTFSDEDDLDDGSYSPDAKDIDFGTLRLRAERQGSLDGRVYLILVQATDASNNTSNCCRTVTVPKSQSSAHLQQVQQQAAAAEAFCALNGDAPAEYFVVGDGPIVGSKQ